MARLGARDETRNKLRVHVSKTHSVRHDGDGDGDGRGNHDVAAR